jgi:hypothetical protein
LGGKDSGRLIFTSVGCKKKHQPGFDSNDECDVMEGVRKKDKLSSETEDLP